MKPQQLLLRCYAQQKEGQWQAFCIDFSLAAQADSFAEARHKLEGMIVEYLTDALVGQDRAYAEQLLGRRAPLYQRLTYTYYCILHSVGLLRDELRRWFIEPIPLIPGAPHCA